MGDQTDFATIFAQEHVSRMQWTLYLLTARQSQISSWKQDFAHKIVKEVARRKRTAQTHDEVISILL